MHLRIDQEVKFYFMFVLFDQSFFWHVICGPKFSDFIGMYHISLSGIG